MYSVRFGTFEGPLDLLLFFIKRDELDIYDIPIASITQEFLDYVRIMEILDLELAGEFVLMAATLVGIKAQMLLPRPAKAVTEGADIDEHDPRAELVQKLLEYKRFKEASDTLATQADEQRYVLYRQIFEADELQAAEQLGYRNATIFDLLKALKRAVERAPVQEEAHVVTRFPISVEEKSAEILHLLKARGSARFFEIVGGLTRAHIVATFLALLELAKNHRIIVQQDDDFDDIIIAPRPASEAEVESVGTIDGIEEDLDP
jgi:segregation and condensation protein A